MSNSMQIRQSALITAVLLLRAVPASPEPRLEPEPTGLVPKATQQQQQRPCSTPEHRQFDFWIDVAGAPLYINGGFAEGRMRMVDEAGTSRITWTPLESGHVRQHWEQSADDGGTWTTVFDGEYRRVY